jgi:hypothetical protein
MFPAVFSADIRDEPIFCQSGGGIGYGKRLTADNVEHRPRTVGILLSVNARSYDQRLREPGPRRSRSPACYPRPSTIPFAPSGRRIVRPRCPSDPWRATSRVLSRSRCCMIECLRTTAEQDWKLRLRLNSTLRSPTRKQLIKLLQHVWHAHRCCELAHPPTHQCRRPGAPRVNLECPGDLSDDERSPS